MLAGARPVDTHAANLGSVSQTNVHHELVSEAIMTLPVNASSQRSPHSRTDPLPRTSVPAAAARATLYKIAARVKLADLLSESQEHEAAAGLLEAVVRAEPDHATAHYLLGLAYRALGKREEARRELTLFKLTPRRVDGPRLPGLA